MPIPDSLPFQSIAPQLPGASILATTSNFHTMWRLLLLLLFACQVHLLLSAPADTARVEQLVRQAAEASVRGDYRHSDRLLFSALHLADSLAHPRLMFWTLTNLGINQAEQFNYADALDFFDKAERVAKHDLGKRQLLSIRSNRAGVYMLDRQYDRALQEYLEIYAFIDKMEQHTAFRGGCALNIASLYVERGDTTQAHRYMAEAERLLEASTTNRNLLEALRVRYLLAAGRVAEADALVGQALRRAPNLSELQLLQARVDIAQSRPRKARRALETLLRHVEAHDERISCFECMTEALKQEGRVEEALAYKDSVVAATRQLYQTHRQAQRASLETRFEWQRQQAAIENLNTRHRLTLWLMVLCLALFIATGFALVLQIRGRRRQRKLAQLEMEQQLEREQRLQEELSQQQNEAMEEKQRARQAIEQRTQVLMSKALVAANKNDQLRELLDRLTLAEKDREQPGPELRKHIAKLRKELDSTEEWRDFTTYFEQVNASFLARLRENHPGLTASELRFLSLVCIHLSGKEIAQLLHITPEYCKKRKQQIARKMGLATSGELYGYLVSLQS